MTFISLDIFSGKDLPVISIPVPVVSLNDYHNRLSRFARNRISHEALIGNRHNIVCREIFQTDKKEIFFLPCFRGKNISLVNLLSGKLFFLRGVYGWNFILIFTPEEGSKGLLQFIHPSRFTQENTYPEGASNATPFSFSSSCASILISEHGCIAKDGKGNLFFQGITVSFLQTSNNRGRSVFVQRRDIFAYPSHPLREENLSSLEPKTCQVIKISCFCRQKDFSYSTHFPVLTPVEAQEKLKNNRIKRLEKYGTRSQKYKLSDIQQTVTEANNSRSLLIVLPSLMEVNVPFGSCRGGELFFSYSDEHLPILQLIFFPHLFDLNQVIPQLEQQCAENWHIGDSNPLITCCNARFATVFSFPFLKLVPSSTFEYKITGERQIEFVSAPRGSSWGVFCSPKKKISLSSSKGTGSIDNPISGASGLEHSEPAASLSQQTATVSVPPDDRQGKQTQKRRRNPVSGPSGVSSRPYPYGPHPYRPLPFCEDRSFSIIPHFQPTATVSVSPDQQEQDIQQRSRNPFLEPSGFSSYSYPQYGMWPFSREPYTYPHSETGSFVEGFYPYGSPLPSYPHPSARQGQWIPVFPPSFSAIRPSVAVFDHLRHEILVQEENVGHSGREEEASASVPIGAVQQTSMWRPDEESFSAAVPSQAQAKNSDEDTDIDVEN